MDKKEKLETIKKIYRETIKEIERLTQKRKNLIRNYTEKLEKQKIDSIPSSIISDNQ